MTTEDTNPSPEQSPAPEAPAPDAPTPVQPVAVHETVSPVRVESRRMPRTLGIVGAVLGAFLLLFAGFAIGHWAVGNGHHGDNHRVERAAGRGMRGPFQGVQPNRQGTNNQPGRNQQGNNNQPGTSRQQGSNNQPGTNGQQGATRAVPDLSQLRQFLQNLMQNRGLNGPNSQGGSGSSSSNSQFQQLETQVQQLQKQVQQLQSQLKSTSP